MVSSWRAAGLNYIRYSNACAQALRRSLKKEFRQQALKTEETTLKVAAWREGQSLGKRSVIENSL
ncbi:ATP synthase subunit epsilon, mitochondrial [Trichoplax sp. H2]|nr:ATP synthase subunit epsilon, mitochondrial [Trichoplax sp. H2]|eukprot:RDD47039.1 ATP synthase subunit epsilon, mitochondrial [Trichoplax sp. H2]